MDPSLANRPAIPCLTCDEMHRGGLPLEKPPTEEPPPAVIQGLCRPSLVLLDRRELDYVSVGRLPLPDMLDGRGRLRRLQPPARIALRPRLHP